MVEATNQQAERSSRAATPGSSLVYFIFACLGVLPILAMPVFQYFSGRCGVSRRGVAR
ncbi:hypothetical protein RS85_00456 [Microbacterium sp. SA39]|nr:hypothetical protein RS85_00456 [Microbacterium sp. SA39]